MYKKRLVSRKKGEGGVSVIGPKTLSKNGKTYDNDVHVRRDLYTKTKRIRT